MRIPSERPSKSWWKTMAVTSDAKAYVNTLSEIYGMRLGYALNSGPDVIASVRPMTREWIMMPISSICAHKNKLRTRRLAIRGSTHQYPDDLPPHPNLRLWPIQLLLFAPRRSLRRPPLHIHMHMPVAMHVPTMVLSMPMSMPMVMPVRRMPVAQGLRPLVPARLPPRAAFRRLLVVFMSVVMVLAVLAAEPEPPAPRLRTAVVLHMRAALLVAVVAPGENLLARLRNGVAPLPTVLRPRERVRPCRWPGCGARRRSVLGSVMRV